MLISDVVLDNNARPSIGLFASITFRYSQSHPINLSTLYYHFSDTSSTETLNTWLNSGYSKLIISTRYFFHFLKQHLYILVFLTNGCIETYFQFFHMYCPFLFILLFYCIYIISQTRQFVNNFQ